MAACGDDAQPVQPQGEKADSLTALPRAVTVAERAGIAANNTFALGLLRETVRGSSGNVLVSPFSVSTALGLTMNGAADDTERAMRRALGWGSMTRAEINGAYAGLAALLPTLDSSVTFRSVNGIWLREPLRADAGFVTDATQFFKATVGSAPTPEAMFAAVNVWARQATEGLVPQALSGPPPQDLEMLLANALLFKGTWREKFDVAKSAPAPFKLEGGTTATVPFMNRTGGFRAAFDANGAWAVELPYGNSAYSMLVFVPTTGTIGAYVATLDSGALSGLIGRLAEQPRSPLSLPRFRVSGTIELKPVLTAMGMGVAFTDFASFPRLFGDGGGHKLAFVKHTVTVDVDEAGTRAAAVTVVGAVPTSLPAAFIVDRPFLFVIRERFTGALLFAGVVRDPCA